MMFFSYANLYVRFLLPVAMLQMVISSCNSKKWERIEAANNLSRLTLDDALLTVRDFDKTINEDSIWQKYNAIEATDTAAKWAMAKIWADKSVVICTRGRHLRDSVQKVETAAKEAETLAEKTEWEKANPKAAKISKNNPEWARETCESLANGDVWVGMTLDMLKAQRGEPTLTRQSDYGRGVRLTWCWRGYKPSCFYAGTDGVVKSYF